ncbi:protein with spectrin repeats [Cryptosporidium sp. chipmunk genotype I]|uniref:protein with spectrin repeats n=1 Tax=Cryptosporidium sp. chipmunk genotype I TaxID=1280935 RepID=UPI00351A28DA|nr:protein with spectrin repeats [Cryptosporidium sp. chipmunk genotype I]
MSKPKSLRYERAIETGVEILRSALNKRENEIRTSLLELRENELKLKKRESNLAESLRVLEQEKKNNEYLRVVNAKTERIFNSAMESLKLKEKKMTDSLDSIISEFKLEPSDPNLSMDIVSKLELLRNHLRKVKKNESDFLEYSKKIHAEKFGKSTGRCNCGYPVFIINGEVVAGSSAFGHNFDGDPEIVELEFKSMELDWERRALEHTKEALRQEKLRQEEILQSREEKIKYKNQELDTRLREVKRMEQILNMRISEREKNISSGSNVNSNPSSISSKRRGKSGSQVGRNSCPVRGLKEDLNHLGGYREFNIDLDPDKSKKKQQKEEERGFTTVYNNSTSIDGANVSIESGDLNKNYRPGSSSGSCSRREALLTETVRTKSSETPSSEEYELYSLSQSDSEILFTSPGPKVSPNKTIRRKFICRVAEVDGSSSKREADPLNSGVMAPSDTNPSQKATLQSNFSDFNTGNASLEVTPSYPRSKTFSDSSEKLIPPRMSPLLRSQRQRLKQILQQEENEDNSENYSRNSIGANRKTSNLTSVDCEIFEINDSQKFIYSTPK